MTILDQNGIMMASRNMFRLLIGLRANQYASGNPILRVTTVPRRLTGGCEDDCVVNGAGRSRT